jgi:hypothetical protein
LLFHASWREDLDPYFHPERDWNVVAVQGVGRYAGTVVNIANPFITILDWHGEGDDKVWVDDEAFPSLFGTGTEDFYGSGWAACQPFSSAFHSHTRCDDSFYGHHSANRLFVLDSIPFDASIRVDLEQLAGANDEKAVVMDALSYWYATRESTHNHPPLTAQDLRLPVIPVREEKVVPGTVIEAEDVDVFGDSTTAPYSMGPWEFAGSLWRGQVQRWWTVEDPYETLHLSFPLGTPGSYCVHAYLTRSPYYGTFQLSFNGSLAGDPVDLFLPCPDCFLPTEGVELGVFPAFYLNSVDVVPLEANPDAPASTSFGLDCLSLIPAGAPIPPVDLVLSAEEATWSAADNTVDYDAVAGDLAALHATGGDFSKAGTQCLAEDQSGLSLALAALDPAPGQGFWLLVRGSHCSAGSYDSAGPGQQGSRDVEIEAAAGACL